MLKQKVVYGDLQQDEVRALYEKFLKDFNRNYDASETESRFDIFKKNLKFIDSLNRQNPLALFKLTDATDKTDAENARRRMSTKWSNYELMKASLPEEMVQAAA